MRNTLAINYESYKPYISSVTLKLLEMYHLDKLFWDDDLEDAIRSLDIHIMSQKDERYGAVYFISSNDYVKIGITKRNVHCRLQALQTGNPSPMTISGYYYTNNYRDVEKHLHEIYSKSKVQGEWFDVSPSEAYRTLKEITHDPIFGNNIFCLESTINQISASLYAYKDDLLSSNINSFIDRFTNHKAMLKLFIDNCVIG